MRILFTILALLTTTIGLADTTCIKCNIDKVKTAYEHLDSLTFQIVDEFLCTFDSTCKNNTEYSEFSNETLFKVLDKSPTLFFQVIADKKIDNKILLNEIENPILDIDLQKTYDRINVIPISSDLKEKYLKALLKAAKNNKQKIRE
jgi:hypothetical protein